MSIKLPAFVIVLNLLLAALSAQAQTLIEVTGEETGTLIQVSFNEGQTEDRIFVTQGAAQFWADRLISNVPITIDMAFVPLQCGPNEGVLGSAGASNIFFNFTNAPQQDVGYVAALANSYAGVDLNTFNPDLSMTFNSDIDNNDNCLQEINWDNTLSLVPSPGTISLFQTLIHEIAHGLGFADFINSSNGSFFNSGPDSYSINLRDESIPGNFTEITNAQRFDALTNNGNLVWNNDGVNDLANSTNINLQQGLNAGKVRMFAPSEFSSGSSTSHFDNFLFPNEVMEPFLNNQAITELTEQLMLDIGWQALMQFSEDSDEDGIVNSADNCVFDANPNQENFDNDDNGDVCDTDDDNDGIPDTFELNQGLDPFNAADASQDPDNDGLTNLEEFELGSDPNQPDFTELEPNNSPQQAQLLNNNFSLNFTRLIGNRKKNTSQVIPHLSILGTGDGSFDFYSFNIQKVPSIGIFDIDNTVSIDAFLVLLDSDGNTLANNDDTPTSYGQRGSVTNRTNSGTEVSTDPFIEFTFNTPGLYTLQVGEFNNANPSGESPITIDNGSYQLHVSLSSIADTPIITSTSEPVIINAIGRLTPVDIIDDLGLTLTNLNDNTLRFLINDEPLTLTENTINLPSGALTLTIKVMDNDNQVIELTTTNVIVIPRLDFIADQIIAGGNTFEITAVLSGPAPSYPVTIPFSIQNNGNLAVNTNSGSITIQSGTTGTLTFTSTNAASATPRNIQFTIDPSQLGDSVNATGIPTHNVIIVDSNIAPTASFSFSQNQTPISMGVTGGGIIEIASNAKDVNGDDISFNWSNSDSRLLGILQQGSGTTMSSLQINPANLAPDNYNLNLIVSDNNADRTISGFLRIVNATATINDSDGDGISNTLDDNNLPAEVITISSNSNLTLSTEAGNTLRLGRNAIIDAEGVGVTVTDLGTDAVNTLGNFQSNSPVLDYEAILTLPGSILNLVYALPSPTTTFNRVRKYNNIEGWRFFEQDDNNQIFTAITENPQGVCPPVNDPAYGIAVANNENLPTGNWCIQLRIEDGGPNDADGEVNAIIIDPVAVQAATGVNDSSLSTLSINGALLSPGFTPLITNYETSLAAETIDVTILANNSNATVNATLNGIAITLSDSGTSSNTINQGSNTLVITVTALDNSTTVYTATINTPVQITSPSPSPAPSPAPSPSPAPAPSPPPAPVLTPSPAPASSGGGSLPPLLLVGLLATVLIKRKRSIPRHD